MTSDTRDGTTLFPIWKELVKTVIEQWDYGSKHEHKECEKIIGHMYGSPKYYAYMNAAKKELAELGHRIKCIKKFGYYKLLPSEYPEEAYCDTKRSVKYLREGVNNINCAPTRHMDDDTKRCTERVAIHMGKTLISLSRSASEVKALATISRPQKMLYRAATKGME